MQSSISVNVNHSNTRHLHIGQNAPLNITVKKPLADTNAHNYHTLEPPRKTSSSSQQYFTLDPRVTKINNIACNTANNTATDMPRNQYGWMTSNPDLVMDISSTSSLNFAIASKTPAATLEKDQSANFTTITQADVVPPPKIDDKVRTLTQTIAVEKQDTPAPETPKDKKVTTLTRKDDSGKQHSFRISQFDDYATISPLNSPEPVPSANTVPKENLTNGVNAFDLDIPKTSDPLVSEPQVDPIGDIYATVHKPPNNNVDAMNSVIRSITNIELASKETSSVSLDRTPSNASSVKSASIKSSRTDETDAAT